MGSESGGDASDFRASRRRIYHYTGKTFTLKFVGSVSLHK